MNAWMIFSRSGWFFRGPAVSTKENVAFSPFWKPEKTWIGRSKLLQSGHEADKTVIQPSPIQSLGRPET